VAEVVVDEARPPVVAATAAVGVAVGVAAGIMQVDRPSPPPFRSQSPTTSTMALRTATIQLLWMLRREQVECCCEAVRGAAVSSTLAQWACADPEEVWEQYRGEVDDTLSSVLTAALRRSFPRHLFSDALRIDTAIVRRGWVGRLPRAMLSTLGCFNLCNAHVTVTIAADVCRRM
jgi:hypothetical protein